MCMPSQSLWMIPVLSMFGVLISWLHCVLKLTPFSGPPSWTPHSIHANKRSMYVMWSGQQGGSLTMDSAVCSGPYIIDNYRNNPKSLQFHDTSTQHTWVYEFSTQEECTDAVLGTLDGVTTLDQPPDLFIAAGHSNRNYGRTNSQFGRGRTKPKGRTS